MNDSVDQVREWLSPSQALTRFQLSQSDLAAGGAMEVEQVRYGVRVGGYGVLLPVDTVSEVLDRTDIFPLPNTAPWFEGLINLRGNVVPVFDLRKLIATAPLAGERQMLLVLDKGERALGIAIDGLPVPAPESAALEQRPPLPDALEKFTGKVFERGESLWLEVDMPGLISSLSKKIAA